MSEVTEEEMQKGEAPADDTVPAAVLQDDAPTDWRERENPYRGAKAVDSDKVFKILLAVVLVGLVAVAVVLAVKVFGHREPPRKADVEPTMHEAEPEQEASFEMPLLSKPQPEGQPISVDASDDAVRELVSASDVYEEIPMSKATGIQSEADAVADIRSRGLLGEGETLSAQYDAEGSCDPTVVSDDGDGLHPSYETTYLSDATRILWSITSQNGEVAASPIMTIPGDGGTEHLNLSDEVIVIDHDTVMSHDARGGRFLRLLPREGWGIVAKVDRVDTQTLDRITQEDLEALA